VVGESRLKKEGEGMDRKIIEAFKQQVRKEPFAKRLGVKLLEVKDGYALVEMACTGDMGNIFMMTHGGAIFTLIDEAFEVACNSHGTVAVALNVNVTYHRAPSPESTLRAEAREINRTRRTGTYHISVKDEQERLIATCQALAYRKEEKLPFLED
jgi:acyl-CoA thioesterase